MLRAYSRLQFRCRLRHSSSFPDCLPERLWVANVRFHRRTKAAFQLSQAEFVIACIKRQIDCCNAIVWVEFFSISWRVYWWIVELCFVVFLSMTISSMNRDETVLELDERYPLADRRRYGWGLGISPCTCNWTLSQPFHHLDKREKHILLIINLITSVKLKLKLDIKDIS